MLAPRLRRAEWTSLSALARGRRRAPRGGQRRLRARERRGRRCLYPLQQGTRDELGVRQGIHAPRVNVDAGGVGTMSDLGARLRGIHGGRLTPMGRLVLWPLPEKRPLPRSKIFAESKNAGSRQRKRLPSVALGKHRPSASDWIAVGLHLGKQQLSAKWAVLPRAALGKKCPSAKRSFVVGRPHYWKPTIYCR